MLANVFLQLFASISYCYAHSGVPVMLIDYQRVYQHSPIKANPFHEISTGYFTDILNDVIDRSDTVIIFAEENLSPEDVTSQDIQGSPYGNIKQRFKEGKVTFFPAVYKPYRVLTQNLQLSSSNYLNLSDAPNTASDIYTRKFFYVFFKDNPDLPRVDKLRRHDDVIEKIVSSVQDYGTGAVSAIYTGIDNPAKDIEEELPEVRNADSSPAVMTVRSKNTMLRFTGLSIKTAMRQMLDYHAPLNAEEFSWGEALTTRVTSSDFVLEFHFLFGKDTWLLDRVTMLEDGEEVGVTRMDIRVPWKRSFICASPLVIENDRDGSAIVIPEYQIEPFEHPRSAKVKRHVRDQNQIDVVDRKIARKNESSPNNDALKSTESSTLSDSSPRLLLAKYNFYKPRSIWTSSVYQIANLSSSSTKEIKRQQAETTTSSTITTVLPVALSDNDNDNDESVEIKKFFSDPVICCPYFTTGILMAFFVVSILIMILLSGIYVLMSCKGNDRFDQPQQLSLFDLPATKT